MKNPQTFTEKLYLSFPDPKLKSIKDYGCCIFVLMWCLGLEPSDIEAIMIVGKMIDKNIIGTDCLVYWDKAVNFLTGRNVEVEKINIKSIKGIKDRTPVRYTYNGHSHWVGVENGKIKFNPLEKSVCVTNGKPDSMRKLKIIKEG